MGFGKDGKGVIITEDRSQAIGALVAGAAILIGTKLAMTDSFRMLKTEALALVTAITSGEDGQLAIGIAHGDLTVGEIALELAVQGPTDRGKTEEQRQAERAVFLVGAISGDVDTVGSFLDKMTNSPFLTPKVGWTFPDEGIGWNWFVYNFSQASFTTGATVHLSAKHFGVWVGA